MDPIWTWSEAHNDYYRFQWRSTLGGRARPQYDLIWARSEVEAPEPPSQPPGPQPPYYSPIAHPPISFSQNPSPYPAPPTSGGPGVRPPYVGVFPPPGYDLYPPPTGESPPSVTIGNTSPPRPTDPVGEEPRNPHKKRRRLEGDDKTDVPLYDPAPDPHFQLIRNTRLWFKRGRIFMVVWPEARGESMTAVTTNGSLSASLDSGESPEVTQGTDAHSDTEHTLSQIHIKVRRFVVYKLKGKHCICFPIYTYSRQGTSKPGVIPEDHAPLVQQGSEVVFHPQEKQDKLKKKLTFVVEDHDVEWNPLSRINIGKPMSIECNLKVRKLGRLDSDNMQLLDTYFRECILGSAEE